MDVKQLAHRLRDVPVIVEKVFPFPLKERPDVIGVELEERAFSVSGTKGVPVQVSPVSVVRYLDVSYESWASFNRQGK